MSRALISHNQELLSLQSEGYEISIIGTLLVVSSVPYVDTNRNIKRGKLITEVSFLNNGKDLLPQKDHTVFFMGERPCDKDGNVIVGISHSSPNKDFGNGLIGNQYFSSKPPSGKYENLYEKITTYVRIICSPAQAIDETATAKTFKPIEVVDVDLPLVYDDSNSSRSGITNMAERLKGLRVGIIGLGGTGSYILDKLAKTYIQEIHVFDGDVFHPHNAFKAPSAASIDELNQQPNKVDYFKTMYSKMHKGIHSHAGHVMSNNLKTLDGLDFVFISIDSDSSRRLIAHYLLSIKCPFIDCGLGVQNQENGLAGAVRTTYIPEDSSIDYLERSLPMDDSGINDYESNIQIAELNDINACMAVVEFKKHFKVFADEDRKTNLIYSFNFNSISNGDKN